MRVSIDPEVLKELQYIVELHRRHGVQGEERQQYRAQYGRGSSA